MKKMKLDVSDLTVTSFPTVRTQAALRGTVHARETETCPAYATYEFPSCYHTDCGQRTCDPLYCGGTGTGGTAYTNCAQYTCPNPNSCPF